MMSHFFLLLFNSSSMTSFSDSFLKANRRSLSASYTSFFTLICGNSDLGDPLFPAIEDNMSQRNKKRMSMASTERISE